MHHSCLIIITALALLCAGGPAAADRETPATMATVVVTGQRLDEYIADHPQMVTVLEGKEIARGNYLDLAEAIGSMPGVDVRQAEGSMQTRISIRGSSGSGHILVLLNGRPMNTSQYGGVELGSLPIDTVRRVSVFKPPIPVWLGPGGTDGAINIETRGSDTATAQAKKQSGQLKLNGGSYGGGGANLTYSAKQANGGMMLTGGTAHRDGKRPNSDKESMHLGLHWDRTAPSRTTLALDGRTYFSEHGVSGPTDNPTPSARQRYAKGGLDLRLKGTSSESGEYTIKSYLDASRMEDHLQGGTTATMESFTAGLKGEHVLTIDEQGMALRLGGLAEQDSVDHTLSGAHGRTHLSGHGQLDREFDDFSLSCGLRGDYADDFGLFPAGSAGVGRRIGQTALLKANAGYSVRVPTFGQLYQPGHGSADHARGNPALDEEKVWSYDLSLEQRLGKKQLLQATLFRSDHRDLIAYQRGEDLISRPLNLDRAHRQGLELTLKYNLGEQTTVNAGYILQESEISSSGRELAYTPRQKATLTLQQTIASSQTRWEATVRAMSSQYGDVENTPAKQLGGRATLDLKVIQPLRLQKHAAELFVTVNNLLDTDFESHYGYPDAGLRGQCGLNITF